MIDGARNVLRGLIASGLWPIAVALVVALVVLPPVLRGAGSGAGGADPPTVAAAPPPTQTATTPGQPAAPASGGGRSARPRDPFRSAGSPESSDAPAITDGELAQSEPAAPGATPAKAAVTSPSGAVGKAGTATTATRTTAKTGIGEVRTGLVSLRFGTAGDSSDRSLRGTTPLPSAGNPLVVLGAIRGDGHTTRVRMTSAVTATGDGICRPSPARCRSIDLRAGDSQLFDFLGKPLYRLDVLSVGGTVAPVRTLSSAGTARATFSPRVRFGAAGATRAMSLDALEALDDAGMVAFQYLGVGADRRSGVFLLGPHAGLRSPNACLDGVACRVISLRPGAKAVVSVSSRRGPRRYELRLVSLRPRFSPTRAQADRSRTLAARAGQPSLRAMLRDPRTAKAVGMLRLSPVNGTVSRRTSAARP